MGVISLLVLFFGLFFSACVGSQGVHTPSNSSMVSKHFEAPIKKIAPKNELKCRVVKPTPSNSNKIVTKTKMSTNDITPYLRKHHLSLLVPLYSYPAGKGFKYWKKLIKYKKNHQDINIIVIANPNDGDFRSANRDYVRAIKLLISAHIKVIGYVYTEYTNRSIYDIKDNVDAWSKFYKKFGVSGIFFDEISSKHQKLHFYKKLSAYARSKGFNFIALNPGVTTDSAYINSHIANLVVSFERPYSDVVYASEDDAWNTPNDKTSLGLLVYGVDDDVNGLQNSINLAIQHNFKYVCFITDGIKNIRWTTLSTYMNK